VTVERVTGLVGRWVRIYTRKLPAPVAERRIGEIDADLHDHVAHERAGGTKDWRIALGIAGRMVRGLPADASWRSQMSSRHPTRKEPMKTSKPAMWIVAVTALILLSLLVAQQFTDGVDWGVFDFVFAGIALVGAGLLIERGVRSERAMVPRLAAAALGIAAIVLGEADDAPGLVLFGCLLILGAAALTVRTVLRGH
jgi:hypothetical protein